MPEREPGAINNEYCYHRYKNRALNSKGDFMEITTLRNIDSMLTLIGDYRGHKINLRRLVVGLEGSINSLEEKLSKEFFLEWHRHWDKLEIVSALGKDDEVIYIDSELRQLELLIRNMIDSSS
jgi:hypothetical protein